MKPITLTVTLTLECRGNISEDVTDWMAVNLAEHAADEFGEYIEDRPEVKWTTQDVAHRPVLAWPHPGRGHTSLLREPKKGERP